MFKVINGGVMPTRGSKYSACVDLYASCDVVIGAGETKLVGLGVCIDLETLKNQMIISNFSELHPNSQLTNESEWIDFLLTHYLQLMLRSSLGKKGLILPNGVGIIDLDYTDEIKMIIHNPLTWKTASNIAISWVNKHLEMFGSFFEFDYFEIDKKGFDSKGSFIIQKQDVAKNIKASKIGQITLLEHKSYLFGIESEVERSGGFGSTGS